MGGVSGSTDTRGGSQTGGSGLCGLTEWRERILWAPRPEGADSGLRRMELLRRKVGSLELGRRGKPLERYAEVLGLG